MDNNWINSWGKKLSFPEDILYSPELMWVKVEPEGRLRVGISDLGVKAVAVVKEDARHLRHLITTMLCRSTTQWHRSSGRLLGFAQCRQFVLRLF